jgi:hypothetical protein
MLTYLLYVFIFVVNIEMVTYYIKRFLVEIALLLESA